MAATSTATAHGWSTVAEAKRKTRNTQPSACVRSHGNGQLQHAMRILRGHQVREGNPRVEFDGSFSKNMCPYASQYSFQTNPESVEVDDENRTMSLVVLFLKLLRYFSGTVGVWPVSASLNASSTNPHVSKATIVLRTQQSFVEKGSILRRLIGV